MFDKHTDWTDSTCYYAAAFHRMHYRLLAGPCHTQAEAEAILAFAQDWALRASGDPAASSYRYAVFTADHGHSRSILGEMKPLKPCGLTRFDGYEIGPCRRWQEDGEQIRFYFETCKPEEADVWTFTATSPARASRLSATSRPGSTPRKSTPVSRESAMPDDDIWDDLFHNAESRLMPTEPRLLGFPVLLTFPLSKTRRHNLDVLSFVSILSASKEWIHAGELSSESWRHRTPQGRPI